MKKFKFNSELAFVIGMILLSFGVQFMIVADFGISVVQSASFVLSEKWSWLSFGMANYFVQVVLIVALAIITKKISASYITSFVNGFIYGLMLDGAGWLMKNMTAETMILRIVYFALGFLLVVVGVQFFFKTNVPLMPYDLFVKQLAQTKNFDINKVKITFDLACLAVALILTFSLFGRLVGIGWGTVICGLFSGLSIGIVGKLFDKFLVFVPKFYKKQKAAKEPSAALDNNIND